jgi:predicted ester cyclase
VHHRRPDRGRPARCRSYALKGIHNGEFFGVPATGREIIWTGAAFFTTNGRQIIELWVLGDIDAVKQQLGAGSAAPFAHK